MSERKLSDWLASNHFEDYAAAARALEAERHAFMLESQRKEIEANELAAEVARLRAELDDARIVDVGNLGHDLHEMTRERDALRAKLEAARAEIFEFAHDDKHDIELKEFRKMSLRVFSIIDGEGDDEA